MKVVVKVLKYSLFSFFLVSCSSKDPLIKDTMLDGKNIYDESVSKKQDYLLSSSLLTFTDAQKALPVVILVHGFSASTFEWKEFKEWAVKNNFIGTSFYTSTILLGGHGKTYDDFKRSSWEDWQSEIKQEYNFLVNKGFTNISFAGSSTGATLLLEMVSSGFFNNGQRPKNFFLIDPIIIPSDKNLALVGLLGPFIDYIDTGNPENEDQYWYHYRPVEALQQLNEITQLVRSNLQTGIILPKGSKMKVYKSISDTSADPVSAVFIYRGVKTSEGEKIDVKMVNSSLHVYTRLLLRSNLSELDKKNQTDTFTDIKDRLIK